MAGRALHTVIQQLRQLAYDPKASRLTDLARGLGERPSGRADPMVGDWSDTEHAVQWSGSINCRGRRRLDC